MIGCRPPRTCFSCFAPWFVAQVSRVLRLRHACDKEARSVQGGQRVRHKKGKAWGRRVFFFELEQCPRADERRSRCAAPMAKPRLSRMARAFLTASLAFLQIRDRRTPWQPSNRPPPSDGSFAACMPTCRTPDGAASGRAPRRLPRAWWSSSTASGDVEWPTDLAAPADVDVGLTDAAARPTASGLR